jgi:hypothetical protein
VADVFDNFTRPAAFGDIAFPFIQLSIKGSLDHKVHKYLHRPGGEVEDLARRAYEFRFECQFDSESRAWPDLYPDRLGQLVALCESGQTFALYVPNLASEVQAKATDWPRTLHASVRSGERVEFAFVEDSTEQYTTDELTAILSLDIGALVGVTMTPLGIGNPISTTVQVAGIRHDLTPTSHYLSLTLDVFTNRSAFILDDPVMGVLDGPGVLIF